jgi:hypothetical protein
MENEEIDLSQIFNSFKKTIVYKKLNSFIIFVDFNKFWLILFLFLGMTLGYFLNVKEKSIYRSEILIKSYYLLNNSSAELIKSLNLFIEENNTIELKKIGFSEKLAKSIKKIEFIFPDEILDSLKKVEPFKVVVFSEQANWFPFFEEAIVKYLSNNPASLENEKIKKDALIYELASLKKKKTELEKMRAIIYQYFYANREKLKDQPVIVDPAAVLREQGETILKISEKEKLLKDVNNYKIIQKMPTKKIPEAKSNKPIIFMGLCFLVFGGLVLFFVSKPKAMISNL